MPAILTLIGPLVPYLAIGVAAIAGYFMIRHKGAVAEREKIEKAAVKAVAQRTKEVQKAVTKDIAVDKSVGEKIDAAKNQEPPAPRAEDLKPGDRFKF